VSEKAWGGGDGLTRAARALCAGLPPLRPGEPARRRPLPVGGGLELLSRSGESLGWCLVPVRRLAGRDRDRDEGV
jgi:hypothetical protein